MLSCPWDVIGHGWGSSLSLATYGRQWPDISAGLLRYAALRSCRVWRRETAKCSIHCQHLGIEVDCSVEVCAETYKKIGSMCAYKWAEPLADTLERTSVRILPSGDSVTAWVTMWVHAVMTSPRPSALRARTAFGQSVKPDPFSRELGVSLEHLHVVAQATLLAHVPQQGRRCPHQR